MASMIMVLAVADLTAAGPPAAAMLWPALAAGTIVGLALGLTGGGGAIFAVPLLVCWIGVEPRTAVTVSLVTVAVTAFVGAAERWCRGQVEAPTGLLFAAAGVLTTPLGGWLGDRLPAPALLAAFAVLMLVIAVRMWRKVGDSAERAAACVFAAGVGPTCSRDADGRLRMTTRCVVQLTLVGLLSGLFGAQVFAAAIAGVAVFIMARTLGGG